MKQEFKWRKWSVLTLLFALLIFAGWALNLQHSVGYPGYKGKLNHAEDFDAFSSAVVTDAVDSQLENRQLTAFMLIEGQPYYSQFGMQQDMLLGLRQLGVPKGVLYDVFRHLLRGASSLVIAAFFAWAAVRFGVLSGWVLAGMMALSDWPLLFSGHVYWVMFLLWLPFVVPWLLLQKWGLNRRSLSWLCVIHLVLVYVRCLCGYEYLTCLVLAPLPAIVFFASDSGQLKFTLRSIMLVAIVASFGVTGFVGAFATHMAKGVLVDQMQLSEIFGKVRDKAMLRTKFSTDDDGKTADEVLKKNNAIYRKLDASGMGSPETANVFMVFFALLKYLTSNFISLFGIGLPFVAFFMVTVVTVFMLQFVPRLFAGAAELLALCHTCIAGAVVTFSWWIAASNHMVNHIHLNSITLYLAFVPCAALFVVEALRRLVIKKTATRSLADH